MHELYLGAMPLLQSSSEPLWEEEQLLLRVSFFLEDSRIWKVVRALSILGWLCLWVKGVFSNNVTKGL